MGKLLRNQGLKRIKMKSQIILKTKGFKDILTIF